MSSSRSEDSYSDTLAQFEEEWANYNQNCLELNVVYKRQSSHLEMNHSDFAKNVKNTVDKTFLMVYEAEELVNKGRSLNSLRRLYHKINHSGKQQKALKILMKKLKENDEKVKQQTDKIRHESNNNTGPGSEHQSSQLFRNRKKMIPRTIPFTEPYDEDLCSFETIDL
ncbi:hypothetical protein NXS19_009557 [Fusarium pseudograminearum]|nr:hypothetical protein NXS19_009557 [Fusarium pseudograminearum]